MLDRGGKQKPVSAITHNGVPNQTLVLPKASPHIAINMIRIRKDEHHPHMPGEVITAGKSSWQPIFMSVRSPPPRVLPGPERLLHLLDRQGPPCSRVQVAHCGPMS